MNFTEFFIRRPALTSVVTILLTVVGLISYLHLPIQWIPTIAQPVVSISTSYPGANPSLVESEVTTPIEAMLSGIDGVESLTSSSTQSQSSITLAFKLGRNMNAVIEDVRSSLARVTASLPHTIDPPVVSKADMTGMPKLFLAFSDPHRSVKELGDYVDQFIVPRMQTIDGVAAALTFGKQISAMRIVLDPVKMVSSNVTVDDVTKALLDQNIAVPSGYIRGKDRYYNVVTNETLASASEFNDVVIRHEQNQTIRLRHVGNAVVAPVDIDSAFRVQGHAAVGVGIVPQAAANPLDVSKHVMKAFHELTRQLPAGMQASVVFNEADFIQESVHSVFEAVFEAVAFVLLVIFLFLGNWRATLVPVITIPICLIATFTLLQIFHFSINTITLMAFVLAIGLVVDDAIVMLENISRYIETGMTPIAAAIRGSREMVFPIIAMTLTLTAVYIPIAFTEGLLGSVFSEFALTLAGSVLVSGLIALILSPMMCARLLKQTRENAYQHRLNAVLQTLQWRYEVLLRRLLTKRKMVISLLCVMGGLGGLIYHFLPAELAPAEDRDQVYVVVSAPNDASFRYLDEQVKKLQADLQKIPEATSYLENVYSNSNAFLLITLKPIAERQRSASAIAAALNASFQSINAAQVMAFAPPSPLTWFGQSSSGDSVDMSVMTVGEYKELHGIMQQLIAAAKKYAGFTRVDSQLKWDREQFDVSIDREKAAALNIPIQTITTTISTFLAGKNVGKFAFGGKQYDVIVQLDQSMLSHPNLISELFVRSEQNVHVPLADLTTIHETTNPGVLSHTDRLRSDVLSANLAPGYTIAEGVAVLEKIAQQLLPDNVKVAFQGEAKNYLESSHKMAFTFFLALLFIYLVLVAQFESFIDPFVILLTVPFAVIGALLTLLCVGGSLNIYSNIGLVTLIGLIAKHGILITEFANQARLRGVSLEEAVIEAAQLRLRPIVMTTFSMVLGALPLALATGPGAETRHQVGWVIVGGLLIGTFFSLIVVPVAYTYLAKWKRVATLVATTEPHVVHDSY